MNRFIKIMSVIFVTILLCFMFNGCKKDEDTLSNPTNSKTTAVFNIEKTYGEMTDQDGNIYRTITIGTQTWMAENLRTTIYRNGDSIQEIRDNEDWDSNRNLPAYCNYNNTKNNDTIATYGRLYNWFAVSDSRSIAPEGWHVPSNADWRTLRNFFNNVHLGDKLKEMGTYHWIETDNLVTNESGFTALPSGIRDAGRFKDMGRSTEFWSGDDMEFYFVSIFCLSYNYGGNESYGRPLDYGCSVRCVKD